MPSTNSVLAKLKNSYPQFKFAPSDDFYWSSTDNIVFYNPKSPNMDVFLLHELSHALLGHDKYQHDIQLLTLERQAWDHTVSLIHDLAVLIPEGLVESTLDSYRDWLHSRSTCPKCQATGVQSDEKTYKCLVCGSDWSVNEAKTCALRRYSNKKRP